MGAANLLFTAGGSLAAAVVFTLLATRIWERRYGGDTAGAGRAYGIWWFALAVMAMTDGLRVAMGLAGEPNAGGYVALVFVKIVATAVAIWGLAYYVVYLWSGSPGWRWPLAVFAVLHAGAFTLLTAGRLPAHVDTQTCATRLVL